MGRYSPPGITSSSSSSEAAAARQRAANEAAAAARQRANEAAAAAREAANQAAKSSSSSTPPALPPGVVLSSRPPGSVGEGGQGASGGSGLGSGFTGSGGGGVGTTAPSSSTPIMADKLPTFDLSGQNAAGVFIGGIVASPAANAAADGWDKFRSIVGDSYTEAEYLFEDLAGSLLDAETVATFGEIGAGLTADIAGLEPVGFAAVLLLSEYGFGWLVQKVGQLFPNPSIFGWRPLNFISTGISNFGGQFEQSASGLGDLLAHAISQPFRQILGLFQRSGNATAAAHTKVAHLNNETIPQSRHDAVVTAGAYTDAQIAQLTVTENAQISQIHDGITAQIATAKAAAESDSAAALAKVDRELVAQLQTDEGLLSSLATTVTVTLPKEIADAVTAQANIDAANLRAQSTTLQGEITTLQGQMATANANIATAQATVATATATVENLKTQTTVDAAAIAAQQQLITTAQSDILTNITLIQDANTKITSISSTLAPIQAAQQLNTTQLAPYEAIGAIALPTVIAALSSQLSKLQTKVDTCVVTTCDPASPQNLKNQLLSLLGLMSAAGELTFLAEAIRDPIGTAQSVAPVLDSVDTSAVDVLNALLSL